MASLTGALLNFTPLSSSFKQTQAKSETMDKVCEIVKKQLALSNDSFVTGDSKFSTLGADSLDTVEIVMGLKEEFEINVEEEIAQTINTVQDATNKEKKAAT